MQFREIKHDVTNKVTENTPREYPEIPEHKLIFLRKKFLPDWELVEYKSLQKRFKFRNYIEIMEFLVKLIKPQTKLDHHAELAIFYDEVLVKIYTHATGKLSYFDFELAMRIDAIAKKKHGAIDPEYNLKSLLPEADMVVSKKDFPDTVASMIKIPQTGIGKKEYDPRLLAKIYQILTGEPVDYDMAKGTYTIHKRVKEAYQGGLRKWFKQKWVNIGKKKKGGGHPECGTSGEKKGYAKCVPASKAASMSAKQKKSAVSRKRSAQNKAGRGGKSQPGQGNKPIRVSTKPKK